MDPLFSSLALTDVHRDLFRNIVSIGVSQNLFDDLSGDPQDWMLAQHVEDEVKPPLYRSASPVIHRPFEDARWFNAISWPFRHWQASRFSDGSFGIWYGCDSVETSVYETAYHWFSGLLGDAGFEHEQVAGERKVYKVACDAALVDLRPLAATQPGLLDRIDYSMTRSIGARLHHEGHPGLVAVSVRRPVGESYAVLNPDVLSRPRAYCQLTYRLDGDHIAIQKQPGKTWLDIATTAF